jgi:ribonuclease HI
VSGREWLVYTDGSCKAAEGAPGGWGFHIRSPKGEVREGAGKAVKTLAKIMEYRAVAEALAALPDDVSAVVWSDNQSLVANLSKQLPNWRANGFAKVDPEIVDSIRRIDAAVVDKRLSVSWQWLRSHNGNIGNDRADALAAQAAREAKNDLEQARRRR